MLRPTFLAVSLLLFSPAAFGQSTSTDSHTLQALLAEVRQLRHDLQTTAVAAQRAQILIYRVQAQEAVVVRASQRLEDARSRLAQIADARKHDVAQIKKYEDMKDRVESPQERKQFDDAISELKATMDASVLEEQELQPKETELEEQLRTEQAKLDRFQDDLDRLDKTLENSSSQAGSTQQ